MAEPQLKMSVVDYFGSSDVGYDLDGFCRVSSNARRRVRSLGCANAADNAPFQPTGHSRTIVLMMEFGSLQCRVSCMEQFFGAALVTFEKAPVCTLLSTVLCAAYSNVRDTEMS